MHNLFQSWRCNKYTESATHFAETEGLLLKLYLWTLFYQSFKNTLTFLRSETEELKVTTQIYESVSQECL